MASTRYFSTTIVIVLLFLSTCVSVILGAIAWGVGVVDQGRPDTPRTITRKQSLQRPQKRRQPAPMK
ncbi:hypothetical protein VTN77DRAFT_2654 [Rasamsonia byssochlamydoides]|uniref:uncharacterized protein n=1 Tax=Rasamsonia byssochlamydoides TaxID=89139 RepID=UPI003743D1EB